ncbi:MAG: hypothetical protein JW944_06460 [Deltaproteobacteria bacterium]|nr:hypothetical protein [Deltaproteobacteria bacterium]
MSLKNNFLNMILKIRDGFIIPRIEDIFLPQLTKSRQSKDSQFIAITLEGGATGISYLLLPDNKIAAYNDLKKAYFTGKDPQEFALEFGSEDPVRELINMASINAICQHVMKETNMPFDYVTDPLGLLEIARGDTIGMVGLFSGLIDTVRKAGAEFVVIEKEESLIRKYHSLPITADAKELAKCNKILCTGTTVLNNSLEEILSCRSPKASISVVGPTVGYFPDPLFACGVDVVGGRVVKNSKEFLQRLAQKKRWTDTTQKTCFQKKTYRSIIN